MAFKEKICLNFESSTRNFDKLEKQNCTKNKHEIKLLWLIIESDSPIWKSMAVSRPLAWVNYISP